MRCPAGPGMLALHGYCNNLAWHALACRLCWLQVTKEGEYVKRRDVVKKDAGAAGDKLKYIVMIQVYPSNSTFWKRREVQMGDAWHGLGFRGCRRLRVYALLRKASPSLCTPWSGVMKYVR